MHPASDELRLGDYQLRELLAETPTVRTWLAEQISVHRPVLLDQLVVDDVSTRGAFLADVRAKASVAHPLIGSVLQAVADSQGCYFTRERLGGPTLGDRYRTGELPKPALLAHAVRKIAEANLYLESHGFATEPFDPEAVHLGNDGATRLANPAVAGERTPDQSPRDMVALGSALSYFLPQDAVGATQLETLFGWMRGEGVECPLSWAQVRDFASQIETQLGKPALRKHRGGRAPWLIGGLAVLLAAGGAMLVFLNPATPAKPPTKPAVPEMVSLPAGEHPAPNGARHPLPAFELGSHEVTIGEYAAFLEALTVLARDQREATFDDPSQPADKTSHQPDDWVNLLAAARANGLWQNRPVTLDTPVVGVDWWDAAAYCEWKQGHLPSEDQWFAALRWNFDQPATLQTSNWLPVSAATPDLTPSGLTGMAGSVAEWTSSQSANPANPLGEKRWVITGASFLRPANGALAREWTADRAQRRPDLGFRLAKSRD
jgi:formylglycine-generating enzyme required for sulfatase activity